MGELVRSIWEIKIRIMPVFLTVLLAYSPGLLQKRHRFLYAPIYFMVYPLSELNHHIEEYLAVSQDTYRTEFEADLGQLRRNLVYKAVLNSVIGAVILPTIVGFLAAFYSDPAIMLQSTWCIGILRFSGCVKAMWRLATEFPSRKRRLVPLGILYVFFLGFLVNSLVAGHSHAYPFVVAHNWPGLAASINVAFFGKFMRSTVVAGILGALISYVVTHGLNPTEPRREA